MFTDSHCHLDFPELQAQYPEILAAMRATGVLRALCICTTLEGFDAVHRLALDGAGAAPQLWATVGVHPDNEGVREPTVADLVERMLRVSGRRLDLSMPLVVDTKNQPPVIGNRQ